MKDRELKLEEMESSLTLAGTGKVVSEGEANTLASPI